jgi:hypothetical protein
MAIIIDKAGVRRALERWFIAARAGETMSARETAELSSLDAAAASNDFFYQLMAEEGETANVSMLQQPKGDVFVAGEDLVAGQIVIICPTSGNLIAATTGVESEQGEPAQKSLPLEPEPPKAEDASDEFF